MKTKRRMEPSSSDKALHITVPSSWEQLNQKQLYYLYDLMACGFSLDEVKTYAFCYFTGILRTDWKKIDSRQLGLALSYLDWIDTPPSTPLRLERIGYVAAVDAQLHGVSFGKYLLLENLYQGYLQSKDQEALDMMARQLYPGLIEVDDVTRISVMQWYLAVKDFFSHHWPDLFRAASANSDLPDMEDVMNAELRALTGGDITKEELIKNADTWRALTELNAKARESKELNNKL